MKVHIYIHVSINISVGWKRNCGVWFWCFCCVVDIVAENQAAAIRAIRDLEINRLLTSLRLLRSYFSTEKLETSLLEYFDRNLSDLCIVGDVDGEELEVCWKTEFPDVSNDIHESMLRHISLARVDHSVCYLDPCQFYLFILLIDNLDLRTFWIILLSFIKWEFQEKHKCCRLWMCYLPQLGQ